MACPNRLLMQDHGDRESARVQRAGGREHFIASSNGAVGRRDQFLQAAFGVFGILCQDEPIE